MEKQIPPLRCGMTNKRTGNGKKQIPFGDDNKKSNDKGEKAG